MANNAKTAVGVSISGVLHVPLMTNVLRSLDEFGMQEEIACEAVKLSISEKLGGFEGLSVTPGSGGGAAQSSGGEKGGGKKKAPCAYACNIDFDGLSNCVTQVIDAHDHMAEICRQIAETIGSLDMSKWSSDPSYSSTVLGRLAELADQASSDSRALPTTASRASASGNEQPPPLVRDSTRQGTEENKEHSSDDGGERVAEEDEGDFDDDRAAMGYQRLLDDDDRDADESGAPIGATSNNDLE